MRLNSLSNRASSTRRDPRVQALLRTLRREVSITLTAIAFSAGDHGLNKNLRPR